MGKAREHAGTQVNENTQQQGNYQEHLYVGIRIIVLYLLNVFREKRKFAKYHYHSKYQIFILITT